MISLGIGMFPDVHLFIYSMADYKNEEKLIICSTSLMFLDISGITEVKWSTQEKIGIFLSYYFLWNHLH